MQNIFSVFELTLDDLHMLIKFLSFLVFVKLSLYKFSIEINSIYLITCGNFSFP